jgi:hypothetical protein
VDLVEKLQIKPGQRVCVAAGCEVPAAVTAGVPQAEGEADAVIAFARNSAELGSVAGPALEAARQGRLAWVAYPKAGQLGTDLNRDVVVALLAEQGVRPVRQVGVDGTWSALRLRPA